MLFPLFDRNPHKRWPLLTTVVIVLNVVCFWRSLDAGIDDFIDTIYEHGFVPQRLTELDQPQPIAVTIEAPGQPPRVKQLSTAAADVYPTLLSMMFLHGGWLHLISNMWMLWVFGDNIEDRLGRGLFVFFYLVGGLIAVLAQWAADPSSTQPVIGASGAVAAVLGAYAVTFPTAKVKTLIFIGFPLLLDLPSVLVLGVWLVVNLVGVIQAIDPMEVPNVQVAYWAHIGGFLSGVILMPLLTIGAQPTDHDWRTESREMFEF
ncbi:rhomboid family intramembrane serine protease [Botrimarina sp.]|uniref:rhomboid family intramembrane serine protease n=1 Tax=Botrimarina sp. TaxID=2795802 RepID=UPI0032EDF9CF